MVINDKKLRILENQTLQPIEEGSTKLDIASLPEAEQDFFDYVHKRKWDFDNMTETDKFLLNTAGHRLFLRSLDLFLDTSLQFFPEGDKKHFEACLLMFLLKYAKRPEKTAKDAIFESLMEM